jgi:four helix bundle protein
MGDRPYRGTLDNLKLWHRALDLLVEAHRLAERLPMTDPRGLRDQLERSSAAVSALIAEGHGRVRPRQFLHFLDMARGSLRETESHIQAARRLGLISAQDAEPALTVAAEVGRMMAGLRTSILKRCPPRNGER